MNPPPLTDHRLGVVSPHSGGVDDLLRPDVQVDTMLQVPDPGAHHTLALAEETTHPRPIRDRSAVHRGGADHGEGEPRVVDLGIPILDRPGERVSAQRRHEPQCASPGEVPMVRKTWGAAAEISQSVVERNAAADISPLPAEVA